MPDIIEVTVDTNSIDVTTSVNRLVTQIEKNIIELVTEKNSIDIQPIINLLEIVQNNTEIVVSNPSSIISVVQAAADAITVSNVTNKIEVLNTLNQIEVQTVKHIIEVNNNPPNTDVDEAEIMFKKRTDFVTDDLIYKGTASPGADTSAAVWRISKITFDPNSNDDIEEDFANGSDAFLNVWDDRASLSYG